MDQAVFELKNTGVMQAVTRFLFDFNLEDIVAQLLYQNGHVLGRRQCFKDKVYHFCHPPTPPALLIVARLSLSSV